MAKVEVTKKDVIWSYVAQIFNLGAGFIILPLVLHLLSPNEIAMNYLMLTVASLIALLDFGFLPQFARNLTYVFSGVPDLLEQGVLPAQEKINYGLLSNMIGVAKKIYQIIGATAFILMITIGTWYMSKVTENFTNVNNSLLIWILFSLSTFFNVYFSYYASLLMGSGQVMESKKAMIAQKLAYIILASGLLLSGFSLLGVVVANLVSPFVGRYLYHRYFYTPILRKSLAGQVTTAKERQRLFRIIWYNSKKMGLIAIASFGITKIGLFLSGLFLSMEDVASYGLMIQLITILTGIAGTHFISIQPQLGSLFANNNLKELKEQIGLGLFFFYSIFLVGLLIIILFGPEALNVIRSNACLPSSGVLLIYGIICLLETNTSFFAAIIVLGNKINFMESSLLTSFGIVILSFLSLKFTMLGILGLVLAQGFCELIYSDWRWPLYVCKDWKINIFKLIGCGARKAYINVVSYNERLS